MKRIRNLVIGGIQSKIFNLILLTVIVLTLANGAVYLYHSNMLTNLASDSGRQQQEAIEENTSVLMDAVITQSLGRTNKMEADNANQLFSDAESRVNFLAGYASMILEHPEDYPVHAYAGPSLEQDGQWTGKVIYAEDADPDDPALVSKIERLANLFEPMISLCVAYGAPTLYIGLPEGVHMTVGENSSRWFEDGKVRTYDPRTRGWYQSAVKKGGVIFTEGELDALTGTYCVECARPVLGKDGQVLAVIGTDLYLDDMQQAMQENSVAGEYQMVVNQNGQAVFSILRTAFPLPDADQGADLRYSSSEMLAKVISGALDGTFSGVVQGRLGEDEYYLTAAPVEATGWVLVSAFARQNAAEAAIMMKAKNEQIQEEATALYLEKSGKSRETALVLLTAAAVLMLISAVVLGKRIVNPLNLITKRISMLSEGNLEFKMEDAYRTGDEVEELALSFATISHKTLEYLETVKQITAEKERVGTELALATEIQGAMLPHIVPAFPDRRDFDIFGSMDPAKEVGGDFYDYFLIDADHLCMVIADVSGKGVPAALFMMASKIILQNTAMLGKSPAEILYRTNRAICSSNDAAMFVTVWLGILELSTGKLVSANAGHEYPAVKQPGKPFELYHDKHGFVLGGIDGMRYKEYEVQLEPGSKLFVYTDGVPEATNADEELFGTKRMIEALNSDPDAEPQDVLKNVRTAVDAFVNDADQFDDLTMLCLEYKGPSVS